MSTNESQMESKCEQPQPETIVEAGVESTPELPIEIEKSDEHEKMNKLSGLEVAIMLPPPPVLVPLVAVAATAHATANAQAEANSRPPSSMILTTDKVDEEEVLSLQVLSARSSTPYTVQGICCANANCGLEATTDSSNASQWKEQEESTQLVSEVMKEDLIDPDDDGKHKHLNGLHSDEGKKYSRSHLLDIRDEMTIIKPEFLDSARLQHLHFRKLENGSANGIGMNRNKTYRKSNPPNDLMPAFFKRKTAAANGTGNSSNSIVYDNFKYNDSNPFSHHNDTNNSSTNSNYRRIGSGRISNREVNWDYLPEEDPDKNNLPEFFNTKDSIGSTQPKPQRPQKKHELDDNSNYVKRVIGSVTGGGESSFRSIGSRHSINSSGEERYSSNASNSTNNRSEEPEWFSCGPTSRLDTIELCGFNESDQQKIRMEMSKNKTDSNNNRPDFPANGHNHKEKKYLAFQFDDFSTSHSSKSGHCVQGGNSNTGSKMPSSKFMPLFNAKKIDDETNGTHHSSTQSLNEFFKRNDMPPTDAAPAIKAQKEKLRTTEMPSVDEIEAKWRSNHSNDSRGMPSSENFNNSSESFKKILHQLNQQQQQQGSRARSISSPPPPQHQSQTNNQQPPLNLFNNDNLSNFIKHRNLQQQLLQKQQQQAAFAQLQFNAILSRPDTQMLLLSLARGEISKHGLVIQLANPNLSQTDREAISAVLTFSAAGQYHQQLAINSNQQQQQQFIANQLQNLALMHQINKSPVPRRNANAGGVIGASAPGFQANNTSGAGNNQRTYTQEELKSHANFILHNAMLKKKLEEQNIGLQKILHLQTSMINSNMNNNNLRGSGGGGNDSMAGTKNVHYQQQQHHQPLLQHQQQQQQQQNNQLHQQKSQRHRKFTSNIGNRNNHSMGRRRSTSSSSSNTASSGNLASQLQQTVNMQLRRQLEQRRNTIATATVGGGDDFNQISQRI